MLDVTGCMLMLCFRKKCNLLFNLVDDFFGIFPTSAPFFFLIFYDFINVSKWIDSVIEKSNRTLKNDLLF